MVSENKKDPSYRGADLKLFFRDVRDQQGKKRCLTVRSWATVKDVKDAIQKLIQVPPHSQRLFFGPLLTSGKELPNHRSLHDAGIYRSGETLLLDIKRSVENSTCGASITSLQMITSTNAPNDICISSSMIDSTPKPLRHLVTLARRAFTLGLKPELVMDGSGGTYFLHDAKKNKVAVFKPADEEPYAKNNPRGYLPTPGQDSLREGIAPGEACIREVAAFLLDHDGFSSVPMTTLAEARHPAFNSNGRRLTVADGGACIGAHSIVPNSVNDSKSSSFSNKKVGSFQEFVRSECSMDDISPSKLSVEQVHKIAILDIRLLNADRNGGNLLCRRLPDNSFELVPIDHGYCLRSVCDVSWMDWCWLDWPQLKQPLSKEHKKYIENLDTEADVRILEERLNICQEALDHFRAASALLKAGVKNGMTLHEIAIMCCRNDNLAEQPSLLERLTSIASELAKTAFASDQWHHTTACRALAEQLTPKQRNSLTRGDRFVRFHRCASSAEFTSLASDTPPMMMEEEDSSVTSNLGKMLKKEAQRGSGAGSPTMLQSSGSDSSSDPGEGMPDKEEVEEWAHNLIEDSFVAVHDIAVAAAARSGRTGASHRSTSVSSDDTSSDDGSNLSSSPKGFWHVRPGNMPDNLSDDDGSFSWSPRMSPRSTVSMMEEALLLNPLDISAPPPPPPVPPISPLELENPKRRQSVKFADHHHLSPTACGPFIPPAMVQVTLGHDNMIALEPPLFRQDSTSGMTRSKSYSALSRSTFSSSGGSDAGGSDNNDPGLAAAAPALVPAVLSRHSSTEDDMIMRTYFLKFIDLVIVREMTRLSTSKMIPAANKNKSNT